MKKITLRVIGLLFIAVTLIQAQEKRDKIIIAGPFASVSHPVLHMIETKALSDVAKEVEFKLWKNPDELRALAIKGNVDFLICIIYRNNFSWSFSTTRNKAIILI